MEIIKDYLRGLPEVGFHRWQSYLSLFSLKRPKKGLFPVRWAFPLAWIKERLKRLYFARGGLPGLPKVGFEASKNLRGCKGMLFFDDCQRWASILNKGGLFSSSAKVGLPVLPKVGLFSPLVGFLGFDGIRIPLKSEKPFFGLYTVLYGAKVGFEAAKDLRGCKGGLFFELCQRWASILNEGGLFLWWASIAGSTAKGGLPEVGFEASKVGFSPLVLNTFIYIRVYML